MNHLHLADILGHPERNGLYRLAGGTLPSASVRLSGRDLVGKQAMLEALATAFAFPDYFGANWDAAADCLADLQWLDGGVVVVITDADVPENRAPETWGTLLDIFAEAAGYWRSQGRQFAVFLEGGQAAYPFVST